MAKRLAVIIKGLIFGVIFLMIWQISKVSLGSWGIVIFFAIILLTTLLLATPATPPAPGTAGAATPKVSILKRIPWSMVGSIAGIVLFVLAIIFAITFVGLTTIAENEQRAEMNVFRVENSTGVSINSGNNYLVATGGAGGGTITLVSKERNPPCVYFNYSGGGSTFRVAVEDNGIEYLYGVDKVYFFSNPVGWFSTCHYKGEVGNNEKKTIKIYIVVKPGDTIRITNYRVWEQY